MLTQGTRYDVELLCCSAEWWRYNVYIMVVGFDAEGDRVFFENFTDKIYELDTAAGRTAPAGFDPKARKTSVGIGPCEWIEVYAYAVTNTFPESYNIKDSPPFEASLRVTADGREVFNQPYTVNQWGGLTVVGLKVDTGGERVSA